MESEPVDLFNERIKRRQPTDLGGMAIAACLREAVEAERITPDEAAEYLKAYTDHYAGIPPDGAA